MARRLIKQLSVGSGRRSSAPSALVHKSRSRSSSHTSTQATAAPQITSRVFDRLLGVMVKHDFLCAVAILRTIDDEDDRDLVSIRSFSTILGHFPPLMQDFSKVLICAELRCCQDDPTLLFRNNSSTSTKFIDTLLLVPRKELQACVEFAVKVRSMMASIDLSGEEDSLALFDSLLDAASPLKLSSELSWLCHTTSESLVEHLNVHKNAAMRVSVACFAFLKLLCPLLVDLAMGMDAIQRKSLVALTKGFQSVVNDLVSISLGMEPKSPRSSHAGQSFDAFGRDLVMLGESRRTHWDGNLFALLEEQTKRTDTVSDWKAFYRCFKRKLDVVQEYVVEAGAQQGIEVDAEDLALELLDVKHCIEAERSSIASPDVKPRRTRKVSMGLYGQR